MVTVDDIKNMHSMREIVEKYGFKINRQGYINCPFHKEKTASMKIYDKSYHCFGCGENGDIFTFIQKVEGTDFKSVFYRLGGGNQQSYKQMFNAEPVKKGIEERRKRTNEEREKIFNLCDELELTTSLIRLYQKYVDKSDVDSEVYKDCYNALQYCNYKADVITEMIINLLTRR